MKHLNRFTNCEPGLSADEKIEREEARGDMLRDLDMSTAPPERPTIFSPDRVYRYILWRHWHGHGSTHILDSSNGHHPSYAMFIGLNPSTADETLDDPTIRRCIGFAKAWGLGALCMTNLYAFRATDPNVMKAQKDPIGDDNFKRLLEAGKTATIIIAAWGTHGGFIKEVPRQVCGLLADAGLNIHCLGTNADGSPKHPLYLKADSKPQPFTFK